MLPRTKRIRKSEFKELGRGVGYHSPLISLFLYKKSNDLPSQFAFLCSKKVVKSAVKRNLLRRRGYGVIGGVSNNILPGYYFIFNFKKGSELATFTEIKDQIHFLLKKTQKFG